MLTQRHNILLLTFFALLSTLAFDSSTLGQSLHLELRRYAYYRGETIPLTVQLSEKPTDATVEVYLNDIKIAHTMLPDTTHQFVVPTDMVCVGQYVLKVVVPRNSGDLTSETHITIAHKPSPHRFEVWLWGGSAGSYYFDHGFTIAGGPYWAYWKEDRREASIKNLDMKLARGAGATIWLCGGISRSDLQSVDPNADDVLYFGAGRHADQFFNPFSPLVEQARRKNNDLLLNAVGDHPAIKIAFFNTELVDHLWLDNLNRKGIELTKQHLGFTRNERGKPVFVAPGVLSDNDRGYRFDKFVYQRGNGLSYANQKTAEDLKRHRQDVQAMTDPYRAVTYRDMFPGLDIVSTWTYTNNDPKLMHYIETLLAVTRGTDQMPMQTVTLLNYPGTLAPKTIPDPEGTDSAHKGWMLMGPDRCKEVSWIILSRAPKYIGYYFSSACNPERYQRPEDQTRVPHATILAIKELSERVYKPYGPMLTRLHSASRRIAVLSSQASRLYNNTPRTVGYPNEQIYGFYTVMAMAHLNADVLFDEHVEAGALKDYDLLAMPRCEVITETMFKQIQSFQQRSGTIVADQYLGPQLDDVVRFDFDFSYRSKVNADAIANGVMFADWNDQLNPQTAKLAKAQGVTAAEDQKIMESYARQLQAELADHLKPNITVDSPTALVNTLEYNGVQYLVLVNDKRTYGERVGQYKAIMETFVPQTVTVTVHAQDSPLYVYDMLQQSSLPVTKDDQYSSFSVELTNLGGTMVALYQTEPANLRLEAPAAMTQGKMATIRLLVSNKEGKHLNGLQPIQLTITDAAGNTSPYSDYYCAENGKLELSILPAINDALGVWKAQAKDLTAGMQTEQHFEVRKKP